MSDVKYFSEVVESVSFNSCLLTEYKRCKLLCVN